MEAQTGMLRRMPVTSRIRASGSTTTSATRFSRSACCRVIFARGRHTCGADAQTLTGHSLMQTVVHVTHEAIQKIGGIGAVLQGLLTSRAYLDAVPRNILLGPFWPGEET